MTKNSENLNQESETTSVPEEEKQRILLHDFIYKDKGRINSIYSQIFKGQLKGLEKTSSTTFTKTTGLQGGLPKLITGSKGDSDQETESLKSIIDPEDMISIHVMNFLSQEKYLFQYDKNFSGNTIIFAEGSLMLFDPSILSSASLSFEIYKDLMPDEMTKSLGSQFKNKN